MLDKNLYGILVPFRENIINTKYSTLVHGFTVVNFIIFLCFHYICHSAAARYIETTSQRYIKI